MKQTHGVRVRAGSWLAHHTGASIVGLAVVWMASLPCPAWGQWTGGPTGPIYYSGGNVGIGTAAPTNVLNIAKTGTTYSTTGLDFGTTGSGNGSTLYTSGSIYSKWDGTGWNTGRITIAVPVSSASLVDTLSIVGGKVSIGTANPQYLLSVNGQIGAKDVIVVNTGWSDYVFRPGYRLRPLSEVNAYIQANHHLPDIPSEAEVKAEGVSVGEMQSKLLAKIEELTLHMIQQEEENQDLRQRIVRLEQGAAGDATPTAAK
jgi:hypothetical protein